MGIFRRAYRAVRSVFRRKRKAPKRVVRRRRAFRGVRSGLVNVKKTIIDPRLVVTGNVTNFSSDTFELVDLPQYLSYTALYEEYRINKIVYSFKALNNMALPSQLAGNVSTLGMIHTTIDYNDSVAPTSIQNMMNDSSYKGTLSNRSHTRTFVPKWLNVVAGGVPNQSKTGWLNCDNVNVSHYAIKWAFEGGTTSGAPPSFYVEPIITYYVSFRNPK